jgi:hypothetical protein
MSGRATQVIDALERNVDPADTFSSGGSPVGTSFDNRNRSHIYFTSLNSYRETLLGFQQCLSPAQIQMAGAQPQSIRETDRTEQAIDCRQEQVVADDFNCHCKVAPARDLPKV